MGFDVPATPRSWLLVEDGGSLISGAEFGGIHHEAVPLLPEHPSVLDPKQHPELPEDDIRLVVPERTALQFKVTDDEFIIQNISVLYRSRHRGVATAMAQRVADTWAGPRLRRHGGGFTAEGRPWAMELTRRDPSWLMPEGFAAAEAATTDHAIDVDQTWRILTLNNDWIRFADAKAGATLAFVGAMGAILFNLVSGLTTDAAENASIVTTCALLFAAALLAGYAIAPRTSDADADAVRDVTSGIFFASIAKNYRGRRLAYRDELRRLVTDPDALFLQLADQVHVNAKIATTKTTLVKWAVRSALCAGFALALVTFLIAT